MDCWNSQVGAISIEMDNGCVLSFYALSLLIENCINLVFYNGECQRGIYSSLLEKKNLALAYNVLAPSAYLLLRHFY